MANIKSQIKRIRTNDAARLRNKGVRSSLKTYLKKFRIALEGGDIDAAAEARRNAARELDRAASKGVIHKRSAANRKARMDRSLNAARTQSS